MIADLGIKAHPCPRCGRTVGTMSGPALCGACGGPWLAWTRTDRGHQNPSWVSTDHATADGERTLCGRDVGGDDKTQTFNVAGAFSCKRCIRKVLK